MIPRLDSINVNISVPRGYPPTITTSPTPNCVESPHSTTGTSYGNCSVLLGTNSNTAISTLGFTALERGSTYLSTFPIGYGITFITPDCTIRDKINPRLLFLNVSSMTCKQVTSLPLPP